MGLARLFSVCRNHVDDSNTHNYTVVRGSIYDSATDRNSWLKIPAVRFFGASAEVERCPFVNTYTARHTHDLLLSLPLVCSLSHCFP